MPVFLAVIPPFHDTIDQAFTYLADEGLVGVADFYVSGKWDLPLRQMPWSRRFFWRCAPTGLATADCLPAPPSRTDFP